LVNVKKGYARLLSKTGKQNQANKITVLQKSNTLIKTSTNEEEMGRGKLKTLAKEKI